LGLEERDEWDRLVKEAMNDPRTQKNPTKVHGPEDLLEIFEPAD
jgi:hypothetical protein